VSSRWFFSLVIFMFPIGFDSAQSLVFLFADLSGLFAAPDGSFFPVRFTPIPPADRSTTFSIRLSQSDIVALSR